MRILKLQITKQSYQISLIFVYVIKTKNEVPMILCAKVFSSFFKVVLKFLEYIREEFISGENGFFQNQKIIRRI